MARNGAYFANRENYLPTSPQNQTTPIRIKAGKECGIGSGQKGMNKVAIKHLKKDQVMSRLIERHGLVELKPRRASTFQSLTQAIIHQQLSGKAAGTILGRFIALYPGKRFPSASGLP